VAAVQSSQWLFRGFLFIGLMIDADGPRVLEYNVRFGDPEAQAILPLVEGDMGVLLLGLAQGQLTRAVAESGVRVRPGASCTVVAASGGYPGPYTSGIRIHLADPPPASGLSGSTEVFFAGVSDEAGTLCTAGGRVLSVSGVGDTLEEARHRAYGRMQLVSFDGLRLRRDIGGPPVVAAVIEDSDVLMPQFRKRGGLLPVVVQEAASGEVLMLGYANRPALEKTLATGAATFWSTSRGELWTKGETSGNRLRVMEIRIDCDQDALLYRVQREGGGVCHTTNSAGEARRSCFYRTVSGDGLLGNSDP
jgi:phosphoribosyl-AMP cyclohydrolase